MEEKIFERLGKVSDVRRQRSMTLITTCEEMLHLARNGRWDRVTELETRRQRELADYFSLPAIDSESEAVAEVLRRLIAMNDTLVELVSEARAAKAEESTRHRHNMFAVEQYRAMP